jgi:hypothetical protein
MLDQEKENERNRAGDQGRDEPGHEEFTSDIPFDRIKAFSGNRKAHDTTDDIVCG